MTAAPKVFISHANEDKERFVLRFYERLRSKGIDAWLDTFELLPGDRLVAKIFDEGLKQSDAVIVVLSAVSITKPFVQKELNTAIVKSIKDQTRIIPIRLDKCEIPFCLIDTIYQEVPDLDSYDGDFERIVNSIYGQYEKPPLGAQPNYVRPEALSIGDLTAIDATIFEHACRIAIEQGYAYSIDAERLVNEFRAKSISEAQIMETQDVLEDGLFIKLHPAGVVPCAHDFAITTYGFEEFAQVGIPNYGAIVADVARFLAQKVSRTEGQYSRAIASETGQTVFLANTLSKCWQ